MHLLAVGVLIMTAPENLFIFLFVLFEGFASVDNNIIYHAYKRCHGKEIIVLSYYL